MRALLASALLFVVGLSACDPIAEVTTEMKVRDPSAVALVGPTGALVVPPSLDAVDAPLAAGRAELDRGSSAAFEIRGLREADRSISLEWRTALPLVNGERHAIVPADGSIVVRHGLDDVLTPAARSAPTLHLDWCTSLSPRNARGVLTSYRVEGTGCTNAYDAIEPFAPVPMISVPYAIDTPWSNVVEIRERTRVAHGAGWAIFGVNTAFFGGLAALAFALPKSPTTKIAIGAPLAAVGLAFDVMIFPTLVAPSHDVVLRR